MNRARHRTALHRKLRTGRGEAGQALVELAIVLVLFIGLIFGIIDGARLLWSYSAVSNAVREGVRWAAVRGSDSAQVATEANVKSVVQNYAVGLGLAADDITVLWNPNNKPGSVVQIQVDYPFQPSVPIFLGNPVMLHSGSQMVISR